MSSGKIEAGAKAVVAKEFYLEQAPASANLSLDDRVLTAGAGLDSLGDVPGGEPCFRWQPKKVVDRTAAMESRQSGMSGGNWPRPTRAPGAQRTPDWNQRIAPTSAVRSRKIP